ncbi:GTP-binding protein [Metabacillus fastidiosus]|uniref:GTP-binding protein n=1 Tax=Metabacillus fastidiosus TaxID=1458 RepID=UPI003D297898
MNSVISVWKVICSEVKKIYELLNGCICCSIQEDLRKTLDIFMTQNNTVDVLLIEGTDGADPVEIANTLLHPF